MKMFSLFLISMALAGASLMAIENNKTTNSQPKTTAVKDCGCLCKGNCPCGADCDCSKSNTNCGCKCGGNCPCGPGCDCGR